MLTATVSVVALAAALLYARERSRRQAIERNRCPDCDHWRTAYYTADGQRGALGLKVEDLERALADKCKRLAGHDNDVGTLKAVVEDKTRTIEDLNVRLAAARAATDDRDDKFGFLLEWVDSDVRPLVKPRRG